MNRVRKNPLALNESTRTLKAFADPVRLRLLNLLSGERHEVCVCHLFESLAIPQPTVSRHLAYLRKNGLVIGRKEGLWVYYRLAKPKTGLHGILLGCLGTCLGDPDIFRQDQERLTRTITCCDDRN
jgi:ArsR family transcriptional regulator